VMDLYEPLYLARPEVRMELYASLKPRTYDQDLAAADGEFRKMAEQLEKGRSESAALARNAQSDRARRAALVPAPPTPDATYQRLGGRKDGLPIDADYGGASAISSVAQAADVGEMFRYQIATPVKLPRGKSAMLPIVNESVEGQKVAIYNESTHAKHPLSGLKLKNSTDLHLMQGPITVFADGTYAGDAQIQDLPPGTERLISYAMDLDTEVAPLAKDSPDRLVSVKINKGLLLTSHKFERSRTYTVKNSGQEAKSVLIEYPLDPAWTLVAPKEPAEKTRNMYRFTVNAEPGKPAALEVKEERTTSQQVAITNLDDGTIQFYINAPSVSDAVKKALQDVVQRKVAINSVVNKRQELERQIVVIDQEQKRIRDNMAQLPKDSDLFRRYVTKFTEQEDQIDALRKQVSASVEEEQKLKKSLDEFLLGMELV
jgi:phage host-nuclease inhibitor protein Gam